MVREKVDICRAFNADDLAALDTVLKEQDTILKIDIELIQQSLKERFRRSVSRDELLEMLSILLLKPKSGWEFFISVHKELGLKRKEE